MQLEEDNSAELSSVPVAPWGWFLAGMGWTLAIALLLYIVLE